LLKIRNKLGGAAIPGETVTQQIASTAIGQYFGIAISGSEIFGTCDSSDSANGPIDVSGHIKKNRPDKRLICGGPLIVAASRSWPPSGS
jgi:hypothetical protein